MYIDDEEDLCLICLLPGYTNNDIKLLTNIYNIKTNCHCNPKLHISCIQEWIAKTETCPICRTKINIKEKHLFVNCLYITSLLVRVILFIINILNIVYHIVYIYYILDQVL